MKKYRKKNSSLKTLQAKQNNFTLIDNSFGNATGFSYDRRLRTQYSQRNSINHYFYHDNGFISTKKAPMHSKLKKTLQEKSINEEMSNFSKLKTEAKCLENQTFLGSRENTTNPKPDIDLSMDFVVNNQFISSKKVSLLQRYRQNIKRYGKKKKKISSFIQKNGEQSIFKPSFILKDVMDDLKRPQANIFPIKKQNSGTAKRYFKTPFNPKRKHYNSFRKLTGLDKKEKDQQVKRAIVKKNHRENNDSSNLVMICL